MTCEKDWIWPYGFTEICEGKGKKPKKPPASPPCLEVREWDGRVGGGKSVSVRFPVLQVQPAVR